MQKTIIVPQNNYLNIMYRIIFLLLCIFCIMADGEILIFNDGNTHQIDYRIDDSIYVQNSESGNPTLVKLMDGGEIWGDLVVYDTSEAIVQGGYIYDDLTGWNEAKISIMGGQIGTIQACGSSEFVITGGDVHYDCNLFKKLELTQESIVTIYGTNFNYPYGPISFPDGLNSDFYGTITGTLLSGQSIDWPFRRDEYHTGELVLLPEPCTISLLALGGLALLRKRRKIR